MRRQGFSPGKISGGVKGDHHPDALQRAALEAGPCSSCRAQLRSAARERSPKQRGAWRGCWRQPSPGGVGGLGPGWVRLEVRLWPRPGGHCSQPQPPTIRKRIFSLLHRRTLLSERSEPRGVEGGRWRLQDHSLVGKGTWSLSPSTVYSGCMFMGKVRGRAAALALCRAGRPRVLVPFCVGSRGASCVLGFPRSPGPVQQLCGLGPRPASPAPPPPR